MAKNIRDLVGAPDSRTFSHLVESKLRGTEDYGYALGGTSRYAEQDPADPHGDRTAYYGETRQVTVSEFIREAHPDWEHVATTDKLSSTRPFSGVPVVMAGDGNYAEQMDTFNRQVLGLDDPATEINLCNPKPIRYVNKD